MKENVYLLCSCMSMSLSSKLNLQSVHIYSDILQTAQVLVPYWIGLPCRHSLWLWVVPLFHLFLLNNIHKLLYSVLLVYPWIEFFLALQHIEYRLILLFLMRMCIRLCSSMSMSLSSKLNLLSVHIYSDFLQNAQLIFSI